GRTINYTTLLVFRSLVFGVDKSLSQRVAGFKEDLYLVLSKNPLQLFRCSSHIWDDEVLLWSRVSSPVLLSLVDWDLTLVKSIRIHML
ncbi:hypothetical protein LDENG_00117090, partial [Lucifuga dentata]